MFKKQLLTLAISFALPMLAQAADLTSEVDRESYALGSSVGKYMSDQVYNQTEFGAAVNMDVLVEGFIDALKDQSKLSEEEVVDLLNTRLEFLNAKREVLLNEQIEKNKAESETYLIDNKLKDGVVTTASGLQYEVIAEGNGLKPKPEDVVTVHFSGRLLNGEVFESTYQQNKPARMAMMTFIPGWQEGLQLMQEGAKYRFTIPAALAYGEEGAGPIPPSSAVIFEIELVKVEEQKAKSMGGMMGMGMGGMGMGH